MPQLLLWNEFVHDLVHPALSQVQDILGYDEPLLKAPLTYATNWGAAFGVLTPSSSRGSTRGSVGGRC